MQVLIIEDEIPAQRMLMSMIAKIDEEIEIVDCLDSVKSAVAWLECHEHPEIILLDIQLSDGISFEILKQVQVKSMIIFTTAYDEYAIQAFKVNSLDYLLKPVEKEELQQAFDKYKTYSQKFIKNKNESLDIQDLMNVLRQGKQNYRKRFVIQANESFTFIDVKDVAYIYIMEKITFAVTFTKREYPINLTLETITEQLSPDCFFRVNRQYIVNMEAIKKVHSYFQGKLVLDIEPTPAEKIIIGRDKASRFKKWINR